MDRRPSWRRPGPGAVSASSPRSRSRRSTPPRCSGCRCGGSRRSGPPSARRWARPPCRCTGTLRLRLRGRSRPARERCRVRRPTPLTIEARARGAGRCSRGPSREAWPSSRRRARATARRRGPRRGRGQSARGSSSAEPALRSVSAAVPRRREPARAQIVNLRRARWASRARPPATARAAGPPPAARSRRARVGHQVALSLQRSTVASLLPALGDAVALARVLALQRHRALRRSPSSGAARCCSTSPTRPAPRGWRRGAAAAERPQPLLGAGPGPRPGGLVEVVGQQHRSLGMAVGDPQQRLQRLAGIAPPGQESRADVIGQVLSAEGPSSTGMAWAKKA